MTAEFAELRRRHAALTPFALRFLSNGPGGEPFIALACEDGSTPLPEPAFDAVLLFAELAAAELPALLDNLDAAEARLAAIEATDKSKLSIQYGWLTYEVGEHTCGGYGPESGYTHEPGCGYEPLLRLDDLTGWPGEALDAAAERDALAAKVERVRDWLDHRGVDASDRDGAYMDGYRAAQRHAVIDAAELRAALDEEPQP